MNKKGQHCFGCITILYWIRQDNFKSESNNKLLHLKNGSVQSSIYYKKKNINLSNASKKIQVLQLFKFQMNLQIIYKSIDKLKKKTNWNKLIF